MAAADPVRTVSRISSDRSGSCSDDIVSLDSWSEKLEASVSKDWPAEYESRPRLSSAGCSANRSVLGHSHVRQPQFSDVKKEKSVVLRSGPPDSKHRSIDKTRSIPTLSGNIQSRERGLYSSPRRRSSSTSSDSDSGTLHSPRHSHHEHKSLSPPRRIPPSGSHYSGGTLHFASHLRPHYQSSPLHRGTPGHPPGHVSHQLHSPRHQVRGQSPHHQHGYLHPCDRGNSPHHHRGYPYYSNTYPQNSYHSGASGSVFDQIVEREREKLKTIERERERLKTKMKSMWNNVKYGWTIKTKTSFKFDSPIFLLGRCYHRRAEEGEQQQPAVQPMPQYKVSAMDAFHEDFSSRLWFTYRREFMPIGSDKFTTDCGWGCMLRSGQMMMAQALVHHFLGRDWKVYSEQKPEDMAFYREIVRWFGDHPSDKVPFSLHRLVELGTSVGKMPGDWYGPASVAHIFRDAVDKAHVSLPILSDICVYVAHDCTIYLQDLRKILTSRTGSQRSGSGASDSDCHPAPPLPSSSQQPQRHQQSHEQGLTSEEEVEEKFRSVIILVPMRLGGETLNEIYIPCVQSMLAHDHCIGIIGGRPKHSLYFVGWQDDKLIYLDPHYCQDTVDTSQTDFPVQSFHCMSPRKIHFSKMDPSCTVGFYCRDRKDLQTFIDQVPDMVVPPRQRGLYPLFVVSQGSSEDTHTMEPPVREIGRLRIRHIRTDQAGNRVRSPTLDSEDFVIL